MSITGRRTSIVYVYKPKRRYAPFRLEYLSRCALRLAGLGLFTKPAPIDTLYGKNVGTRHIIRNMALGKLFTGRRIRSPVQSPSLLLAAYAAANDAESVRTSTVAKFPRCIWDKVPEGGR